MEEPRPCNVPDSFTTAETLVAYTNGTRDCKAAGDGAPSPAALDSGETTVSSTAASLFFTLLISFFCHADITVYSTTGTKDGQIYYDYNRVRDNIPKSPNGLTQEQKESIL